MKQNSTTFIIQRQQLTSSPFGFSDTKYDNIEVCIKTDQVITEFHNKLFIPSYKSPYSDEDIRILDRYKTIVPCGNFKNININNGVEVGVRKAFTGALCKIEIIPLFN